MRPFAHRFSRTFVAAGSAGAAVLAAAVPVVALAVATAGGHGWAAPESVTATFVGFSRGHGYCTAHPKPAEVTIRLGTELVIVNNTGADALLDLGGDAEPVMIGAGDTAAVQLEPGEHSVRLRPACQVVHAEPLLVLVRAPTEAPVRTNSPAIALPTSPGTLPSTVGAPEEPDRPRPSPRDLVAVDPDPFHSRPAVDREKGSPPPYAGGGANTSEPIAPGPGGRLAALLATICVFGVTTALIRAILTGRATRTNRMMSA